MKYFWCILAAAPTVAMTLTIPVISKALQPMSSIENASVIPQYAVRWSLFRRRSVSRGKMSKTCRSRGNKGWCRKQKEDVGRGDWRKFPAWRKVNPLILRLARDERIYFFCERLKF